MKQKLNDILFKGYVREPLPLVIIASFVGIVFLVFAVWSTIGLFVPLKNGTIKQTVQFVEYELDGPIYLLLSSDGYLYDLPDDAIDDILVIDSLIENQVSVYIEYVSTTDDVRSLDLVSVSTLEGLPIISATSITEARATDAQNSSIFMWIACLLYWFFISTSYYFISNAQRFPRIASLLVRESFRNF